MQFSGIPTKSQTDSVSNSRALFLTQQNTFSPLRKKAQQVKQYAQQVQKGEIWQMNKLCDNLLEEVSQLKTQQVLSLYRQVNRSLSQGFIEKQGEMNKLQKVSKIDIGFLRKKFQNEPVIDFGYLNDKITTFEQQVNQVTDMIQGYHEKISDIQKQFG